MPNFIDGAPSNVVRCTSTKCAGKTPWIKPNVRYILVKPDEKTHQKMYAARARKVVWYCCHCNCLLPEKEIPDGVEIAGVPELDY